MKFSIERVKEGESIVFTIKISEVEQFEISEEDLNALKYSEDYIYNANRECSSDTMNAYNCVGWKCVQDLILKTYHESLEWQPEQWFEQIFTSMKQEVFNFVLSRQSLENQKWMARYLPRVRYYFDNDVTNENSDDDLYLKHEKEMEEI